MTKQGNAVFFQTRAEPSRAFSVHQAYRSVGSAEKNLGGTLMQTAAEREQLALSRLVRIKENIENQARKDVEKLQKMFTKNAKREKHFKESREFAIEDAKARHEKQD
jgi:hypothetical protein